MSPIIDIHVLLFFRREKRSRNGDRKRSRVVKQKKRREKSRTCDMVKGSKRRQTIKNVGGGKEGPWKERGREARQR